MEWISVKDRLPKPYQDVLVTIKSDRMEVCVHEGFRDKMFWYTPNCSGVCNDDITHWMPLPEPPKEGAKNENR